MLAGDYARRWRVKIGIAEAYMFSISKLYCRRADPAQKVYLKESAEAELREYIVTFLIDNAYRKDWVAVHQLFGQESVFQK